MENNPAVEISNESKPQVQFGSGLNYRENKISPTKVFIAGSALFIIALIPTFLVQAPDRASSTQSTINIPDNLPRDESSINLEQYSKAEEAKAVKTKNLEKIVHYRGVEKINRQKPGDIPQGIMLKAVLKTGASNGIVKAELMDSLRANGETIISAGTILMGNGQTVDDRLQIVFTYQDKNSNSIQGQAIDSSDQMAGLVGSRIGQYAGKLALSAGLNFLGGLAEGLQEKETMGIQAVDKSDLKNAALHGASQATLNLANETMSNIKNQPPTISVSVGTEFLILFGTL